VSQVAMPVTKFSVGRWN